VIDNDAVSGEWPRVTFIYLDNKYLSKYGKVRSKQIFNETEDYTFVAVGQTSEGEYKLFEMDICYNEVEKYKCVVHAKSSGSPDWSLKCPKWLKWICEFKIGCDLRIILPSLMSIVCFLILPIFYSTAKMYIFGNCMINFLGNSLINQFTSVLPIFFASLLDSKILDIIGFSSVAIIIYTIYTLYFWLNIIFFEVFYRFR
jgi:hypothetical protein